MDIQSVSSDICRVAWYENRDALGHFGEQQVSTALAKYANSVQAAEIDGNDNLDVLSPF